MVVLRLILLINILKRENKMATLTSKKTKKSTEIKDNSYIRPAAEKLGVPFACNVGSCGSCMIDIVKGKENLSELTQAEKDVGLNKDRRFACQCKIKSGEVVIDF